MMKKSKLLRGIAAIALPAAELPPRCNIAARYK